MTEFWLCLVLLSFFRNACVYSLSFDLNAGSKVCLSLDLLEGDRAQGTYTVKTVYGQNVNFQIINKWDKIVHNHENFESGKLDFLANEKGQYALCFTSILGKGSPLKDQRVSLEVKVKRKLLSQLDKQMKNQKSLELLLGEYEELGAEIAYDITEMRRREESIKKVSESINSKLLNLNLISMVCLIASAAGQVFYLRKFFKSKKLVD
ncbi:transmembrane emp24 domain-containing protein bai-like [Zophobas morio]|uniref:transmembrane emp24 domain-containing protein bai-like n=1 Tax=Zophobas morio TaxID=2755281 RepID=UPI003082BCD2